MTLKGALHILRALFINCFHFFQLKEFLMLFFKGKVGLMNYLNDSSSNIYNSYLSSRLSMLILFFLTKYSYSTVNAKVSLVLNVTSNIPKP